MSLPKESKPLWYVVHTYTGYENKVYESLLKIIENRGIADLIQSVKVPTEVATEMTEKGEKEIERKLFPSYVFVKMVMNDEMWHIVRNTTGVTGFVGPGSRPVPLSEEEVEKLGVEPRVIEVRYSVGDSVKICAGALKGQIGIVDEISLEDELVKVTASMFGRETKVELGLMDVSPLEDE
ncbi:MAG: transcription termination/antitermination factor NusG [Clostridia bacterium]|nr:transcription termination/antitermination factor NusG [Clostridia bacterium]